MNLLDCSIVVQGSPMSDIGLDRAYWVHPDGRRQKVEGLTIWPGETVLDAMEKARPPGAQLEIDGRMQLTRPH